MTYSRSSNFAVERFGGLHVMCNNAGIGGPRRRFLDDELVDFEAQMRVNIFGVMVGPSAPAVTWPATVAARSSTRRPSAGSTPEPD